LKCLPVCDQTPHWLARHTLGIYSPFKACFRYTCGHVHPWHLLTQEACFHVVREGPGCCYCARSLDALSCLVYYTRFLSLTDTLSLPISLPLSLCLFLIFPLLLHSQCTHIFSRVLCYCCSARSHAPLPLHACCCTGQGHAFPRLSLLKNKWGACKKCLVIIPCISCAPSP